ncbi:TRAP transporter small permease [Cohaesibacter gelatinilyticus]|uniref:TRAP transporter small permease protein n=1 Tax=Cohaesibacter gelatinilyticus TaxID=372072 RepID=A0A285PIU2_9HYPH|nr:TRAP transporter small permease [Cohaesibacter gelatinilyticus]SNZ21177.1 TRAP-type C4-dicarboxylate transport system, small permease component [Cohaesibacter gelatinilyticus]
MLRLLDKIVEAMAVFTFAISSAFVFLNVVNRYLVLGLMRDWAKANEAMRPFYFWVRDLLGNIVVTADEVPGLLLVWVAFLGAYLTMRREGHIAFELLEESLPKVWRKILRGINTALICGFLVLLFWQSIRMIRVAGATEIETAEIAQGWFMLIMPLAAVLLFIATIQRFLSQTMQDNERS